MEGRDAEPPDWRHIRCGWEIPGEGYCDQPYVVRTDDGAWLCIMTTGAGHEGQPGQHVVSRRSTDQGRTWTAAVPLEPADGPEASYAVLLKIPTGRVYAFYNHNTDDVRRVRADDPPFSGGYCTRVDSLGHFVFRYSDDHGRSWSAQRHDVPQRLMEIDRQNADEGRLLYFWNVGRPFVLDGAAYVSLHKVGGFGEGFFTRSEGVLLCSDNLLTEPDPQRLRWETLPEGDAGLRTPPGGGPVAEEHSYAVLGDGSLYCVYRTVDGHPACSYSRDGGRTWSTPDYQRYADGRPMKHPRAANFVWACGGGRLLYWYHNHGGRFVRQHAQRRTVAYEDRNPVWVCGGWEVDGPEGLLVRWSQPEILLYDDDPYIRISYPDLVVEGGRYFATETQKRTARVHELDAGLLAGLWAQGERAEVARDGLLLDLEEGARQAPMPRLPAFCRRSPVSPYGLQDLRQGFSLEVAVRLDSLEAGQVLLDTRLDSGQGLCLQTGDRGTVEVVLNDGRTESRWACDPGLLVAGRPHHVVVTVDGGPRIITFVVDGLLCDGGDHRQFGWGRFSPHLREANGGDQVVLGDVLCGRLRFYGRALRTSEAIGNWRAQRAS
ncbi:MAG: LamG-like jellyroll fold domain-containing protein [Candidatus Latescibacterota bacterium]